MGHYDAGASPTLNLSAITWGEDSAVLHYRPDMPRSRRVPYIARKNRKSSTLGQVLTALALVAFIAWSEASHLKAAWTTVATPAQQAAQIEQSVYFSNCAEARAAGAAPISRGEPGYRDGLDGDSDGVACEPYHGRF